MYLQTLTTRLADGLARLPEEVRNRHVGYVQSAQNADGGFSGRQGGSDLYYTGFALRSLAVLDGLTPAISERVAGYLRQSLRQQVSVIDLFSLLYSCFLVQACGGPEVLADSPPDWPKRVSALLETFRAKDGGYGKTAGSALGSTYHTFLVGLCYQLLGREYPQAQATVAFIQSQRRDDGGYVEIAAMKRSGTNPTAAAVGTLQLVGDVPADVAYGVSAFLLEVRADGGLKANTRIFSADLLSTFTGAWTLLQLGALDRLDAAALRGFVEQLAQPPSSQLEELARGLDPTRQAPQWRPGGFRSHQWDDAADLEYTFYGLGVWALVLP